MPIYPHLDHDILVLCMPNSLTTLSYLFLKWNNIGECYTYTRIPPTSREHSSVCVLMWFLSVVSTYVQSVIHL